MSTNPSPVPKPGAAGTGKVAIVTTKNAFVNVRTGPGTQYKDIGDIRKHALVVYYPATLTNDNWIWVEQYTVSGWAANWLLAFEDTNLAPPATPGMTTPYDGAAAIWHWKGDVLPENTIEDVVRNIKREAPNVRHLLVKTSDYTPSAGAQWQGRWDTKRALAIDGPQSIDRWVEVLERHDMQFHAWCVPRSLDVAAETDLIIKACLRPGVKSMILDVEPYEGFWSGGKAGVRPFMTVIRRALPGRFHIGIAIDPRPQHFKAISPEEWFPFVNSVHPMAYWVTFRRPPDEVLKEVYAVWGRYGRPIVPILQGDADQETMQIAQTLSVQRHGARSVSWWRLGVIGPREWAAVNVPIGVEPPPAQPPTSPPGTAEPPPLPGPAYVDTQIIRPADVGYASGSYTHQPEFKDFQGAWGWTVFYKATEPQTSKVWARWSPALKQSGKYEISTFVPSQHTTTQRARFKIHGVRDSTTEILVEIDQSRFSNQWVTLGVFELEINTPHAGTVFLNDLTGETDREIAFDAIRWRRAVNLNGATPAGFADGYDSPIGNDEERAGQKVWPGRWLDASPFGKLYFVGTPSEAYHTGADLNLPRDADAHAPVYASASGEVVFASRLRVWGNLVIVKHDPLTANGKVLYGRYAHVENVRVEVGDRVKRGQHIANVSNAFGQWAFHLHFDLSPTNILETKPSHWPGKNREELLQHYVDPRVFILDNRPVQR